MRSRPASGVASSPRGWRWGCGWTGGRCLCWRWGRQGHRPLRLGGAVGAVRQSGFDMYSDAECGEGCLPVTGEPSLIAQDLEFGQRSTTSLNMVRRASRIAESHVAQVARYPSLDGLDSGLAALDAPPWRRPGDFPRGWTSRAGVPTRARSGATALRTRPGGSAAAGRGCPQGSRGSWIRERASQSCRRTILVERIALDSKE